MKIKVVCRKEVVYKNGKSPLAIRFTHNRIVKMVSIGLSVEPYFWDFETQMFTLDCPERRAMQTKIDNEIDAYLKKIRRLEALDVDVNFDTLFENNQRRTSVTVEDCFMREISRLESLGKFNSVSKIKTVFSLVGSFRSPNVRLEEIDLVYLNDFELFLRKRGNKDNSVATKFTVLKAIYNKAVSEELFTPKSNPFVRFKVGRLWTATRKRAITKEELQKLIDLEIPSTASPYVDFARDVFLFTYYTAGINIGDIAHLEHKDIHNGRINYIRRKTGKDISCQLMPIALQIIEKHSSPFYEDGDYIFPILNKSLHTTDLQRFNRIHKVTAKVNKGLRELAVLAGIKTHLTTYVARHTYATVLKRSGVNVALISESLGHSDLATTQIYLDSFENSQLDEAMRNLL